MSKKILIVGSGGREHALAWKLAQSSQIEKLYVAPGNAGIAEVAECVDIAVTDIDQMVSFAKNKQIDLAIVGPEIPLMEGIVDRFNNEGLKIFGPTAAAARLEGSKVFSKNLFNKYNIPTASYEVFDDIDKAREFARSFVTSDKSVVIKADGLAAGKGVIIANTVNEADEAIDIIMKDKSFGEAGNEVVIEEFLTGEEVSVFVVTDGKDFVYLTSAQDHKRVFDNDEGPNTGGMGAYTSPPIYTEEIHKRTINEVIIPTIDAMEKEGNPYMGVLYAGLIITSEGPKVLEFNARFGDPEAQVIMPMIKGDILPLFEVAVDGKLKDYQIDSENGVCICVVLASGGYPGEYEKGKIIKGIDNIKPDNIVFHAGTAVENGDFITNGGRVLAVVSKGNTTLEAIENVYEEVEKIYFEGMHYRKDIGKKAVR
ncbi:Phosphoribosylamine--glycine ligase [Candidatus Syntrophocurvum alkaliphilum]|uniref:Phosphoribosylamine--glycine ligase n=1 Tax=Candidatus Syntrophocurvum alkaliphilum TaxID=2293317 RepID=A0A6I6DDA9_9FIRM|nr:phosphoribosylamine--glycine ligase [Candidatus Syntrophocurvum alkaliphilum]QGT98812.1 Phosphoribosylamine--glycine ligase [Candidatus Syntrophocurvum alkaliphilum]